MSQQDDILRLGRTTFAVHVGDIARCEAEVLVNSAGTGLSGEHGHIPGTVSHAIRQRGGQRIFDELRAHEPLVPGDVVVTGAGTLEARYVYHAVVVGWRDEQHVLQATIWRAVSKCMALAQLMGVASIAFPALGTGSGRAGLWETCSTVAAACLDAFRTDTALARVVFCFLDAGDASTMFRRAFYQQQLIRELRGLPAGGPDAGALATALERLNRRLLASDANADELERVVNYAIERSPQAVQLYIVSSYGGGAVAVGDGATAVGERGVLIGGDSTGNVTTGDGPDRPR